MQKTVIAGVAASAFGFATSLLGANALASHRTVGEGRLPARVPAAHFAGARASYDVESSGNVRRVIHFSTQIQHVVVIVMENRSLDNLFAGYYAAPFPTGGTWGRALDLYDPNDRRQPLRPNSLSALFDPLHGHQEAFVVEAEGHWDREKFSCVAGRCPPGTTAYSYVPTMETSSYRQLVSNWAFASEVHQANEGPSWPAHQYLIAGQSGGIRGSLSSPFSEAENPGTSGRSDQEVTEEDGDSEESPDVVRRGRFCGPPTNLTSATIDMLLPYSQREFHNPALQPCEEYGDDGLGTILDTMATRFGSPDDAAWQYIAHNAGSIWSAPLGVRHLNAAYYSSKDKKTQPFAVDPDAAHFITDLASRTPSRPFARLTYITPCFQESDHPIVRGSSDGPKWLAYVVNAIGESRYWPHTAIVVTWDDWGGWFDHISPFHPFPNPYPIKGSPDGNPSDPYEYGFRVPLIVISPYARGRAYVSTKTRSYSSILHYIEDEFDLPSLDADDAYNDDLRDLFDFSHPPLPYVPVVGVGAPKKTC